MLVNWFGSVAMHCRVRTDGSSTENLLSQRVRFEARMLTTSVNCNSLCILFFVILSWSKFVFWCWLCPAKSIICNGLASILLSGCPSVCLSRWHTHCDSLGGSMRWGSAHFAPIVRTSDDYECWLTVSGCVATRHSLVLVEPGLAHTYLFLVPSKGIAAVLWFLIPVVWLLHRMSQQRTSSAAIALVEWLQGVVSCLYFVIYTIPLLYCLKRFNYI